MSASFNPNRTSSLSVQRQLQRTQTELLSAIARLSSGLRIQSARDDGAGLAVAERLMAQIRGWRQGARNANDGISLAQKADVALSDIAADLQRMRELAVQGASATTSTSERASLQLEVAEMGAEVDQLPSRCWHCCGEAMTPMAAPHRPAAAPPRSSARARGNRAAVPAHDEEPPTCP